MSVDVITKAPVDVLDFDFEFARWMPDGDSLNGAVAEITDSTATVQKIDRSDTLARVWIQGGDDGDVGKVTVTVTTSNGRTKQVVATLKVRNP